MSAPSATPLAKNCTVAMGAEPDATAVTVCAVFTGTAVLEPGPVMVTVGAVPTLTETAADVADVPILFVTVAVSETAPAVVGVHDKLNGEVVLVPISVAPAKYCTLETEPTGLAALTVSVVATLIGSVAAAAGAVIDTVGATEPETVRATEELVV